MGGTGAREALVGGGGAAAGETAELRGADYF